jgi:hypothetical protein
MVMKVHVISGALALLVIAVAQWTTPASASHGCIRACEKQFQHCRSGAQSTKGEGEEEGMQACQSQWQGCLMAHGVSDWKAYAKACYS